MITVTGHAGGAERFRFALAHGADPAAELAARGWAGQVVRAHRPGAGRLELGYAVVPAPAVGAPTAATDGSSLPAVRRDVGLTEKQVAAALAHQRVAAYAVVRSVRGVLLTELSSRTNAAGRWNLPGGGVEPREDPLAAVRREVSEETGQVIEAPRLLTVLTARWVGRSPRGRVEDFHAVRIFCTAWCGEPTYPVVHDVDGSTSDARWAREEDLGAMPLATSVPEALGAAGVTVPGP
ncbi:MAG TPA: NUDIX domain-containing protein [Dermatophilaceae bacterium]|nr:NUDIX domain-containing protein [Dermatophilaceae bacterium]